MTSDGDALLRAICEEPWEDTPRLVYADWLEENGQAERAEFIRLQIELARMTPNEQLASEQYERAESLRLKWTRPLPAPGRGLPLQFRHAWSADLPTGDGVVWREQYVRGFQNAVTFASMTEVRTYAEAVVAARPVDDVTVTRIRWGEEVGDLLAMPWVSRLTALHLSGAVGDAVELIARSAVLDRLEHLDLANSQTTDDGLRALAMSSALPNLKRLGLRGNGRDVTENGLLALMNSPTRGNLKAVDGVQGVFGWGANVSHIRNAFYKRFSWSR